MWQPKNCCIVILHAVGIKMETNQVPTRQKCLSVCFDRGNKEAESPQKMLFYLPLLFWDAACSGQAWGHVAGGRLLVNQPV